MGSGDGVFGHVRILNGSQEKHLRYPKTCSVLASDKDSWAARAVEGGPSPKTTINVEEWRSLRLQRGA